MKEIDKKRNPNNNQIKPSARSARKNNKLQQENPHKTSKAKEIDSKASPAKPDSCTLVRDSTTGTEASVVYETMGLHYGEDVCRSEDASQDTKTIEMAEKVCNGKLGDHSPDLEREPREGREEESDSETLNDSVSSQGDSQIAEDEKLEGVPSVSKFPTKSSSSDSCHSATSVKSGQGTNASQTKASQNTPSKVAKSSRGPCKAKTTSLADNESKNMKVHPKPSSECSEGFADKHFEEVKDTEFVDEASNGTQSVASDNETVSTDENDDHESKAAIDQKIEEMEMRIGKLEEELREVAALEISLYSMVPEHGSSAHKVHTPARRLSRLYIHACKHWSQDVRATVARNTISGIVLIAKSCGNDVPRLTFWLSNAVVLREIIAQAFGISFQSAPLKRIFESNGGVKKSEEQSSSLKWKVNSGSKGANRVGQMHFFVDWQETRTFTAALEKVESWIFSRIVESIWWQTLTPNMQLPVPGLNAYRTIERLMGPALGDQLQGSFSINLWKNAFEDAFRRLCPVRAAGHECGCLPVLARMVMEQCVARLDVAMFNAILRESAHEIPTDPVSDPIVDSKVLPIPDGDLSFGSGAQLKNSVGNWSRWLALVLGKDGDGFVTQDKNSTEENDIKDGEEFKYFHLLDELSDLLMLPKDMLMDRSIKAEVCPSISLPLVKRILCNFTPDEFCPDPVPGAVLEALNAECIIERSLSGDTTSSFPYTAAPAVYSPPSAADVGNKIAEAGGKVQLSRNASVVQRRGYTSDEELDELDSPLTSIIEKSSSSPAAALANGNRKHNDKSESFSPNARYELLRAVWLE